MQDNPKTLVNPGAETSGQTASADPLRHLCALLPSVDQLKQVIAPTKHDPTAQSLGGSHFASVHVPRALLNPVASLPPPILLTDVKERLRALTATLKTPSV